MNIIFPSELSALSLLMHEAGERVYAVGGLVRNACLGLSPSDIDICSSFTPEKMHALCTAHGIRCLSKAPEYGTIEIHMGELVFEHTTFRGDQYGEDGAHRPQSVQLGATLFEDAFRRDFTCNALYADILTGEIIDPSGGLHDIEHRVLRATSKDPHIILRDDALRVMRLIRFACELGFSIDESTFEAACIHVHGLNDIAYERKRDELTKIILSDMRYPLLTEGLTSPVLRGLMLLYKMGALAYILPELLLGEGVLQRAQYHAYDVLTHNLHTCAFAEPTLTLRLAALLHDVGKPAALQEKGLPLHTGGADENMRATLPKGTSPMLNHDTLGVAIAREALTRLRYPNALIKEILPLIEHHMYDLNGRAKESTLRAKFALLGYECALRLCSLREADILGSGKVTACVAATWRDVIARMRNEGAPFSLNDVNCTGADIMRWLAIPAGTQVGTIKLRLLKHCAQHPQDNTPMRLEHIVKGMK